MGVYQTHANKNLSVSVRGTGSSLERSVLGGTAIGFAHGWEAMLERAIAALKADEAAALKAFNDENNPVGQRAYDAVAKAAEVRSSALPTISPSLARKCPRLRKRSKLESANKQACGVT